MNVLLARAESDPETLIAKICDFGETALVEEVQKDANDAFIGTPVWAAPELLRFPRLYSQASDVYAVALVVWQCMSLVDPSTWHPGPDYHDFVDFMGRGARPVLATCLEEWGTALCHAVGVAWHSDPGKRGTCAELEALLQALTCPIHPLASRSY